MDRKFKGDPTRWVVNEIVGMQLNQAFVVAKSVGVVLRVNSIDGKSISPIREIDARVSVDVFDSSVRKAWV